MARQAVILGLVLLLAVSPAAARAFPDLETHWARQEVQALAARGLVEGLPDGRFHPDLPVTRAELVKLLVAALEGHETARLLAPLPSSFTDMGPRHWANGYVESAFELGLARGYGDGSFAPDRQVIRAEVAVLLVRAGGWEREALARDPAAARRALPFRDSAAIPDWAAGHVLAAWQRGLVGGFPDGSFRPGAETTRGQAATLVARLLRFGGGLYDLVGEVVTLDPAGSLTVATGYGQTRQVSFDPQTVFYRQGSPVPATGLRLLDEVRAILSPAGEVLYLEAFLQDARGSLVAIDASAGTLTVVPGGEGDQATVKVAKAATLVRQGVPARLADFLPGDQVYVVVSVFSGEARVVWGGRVDFEGTVQRLDRDLRRLEVVLAGEFRRTFALAPAPTVLIDGRPAAWEDLRPGDRVNLGGSPDGSLIFIDAARELERSP